MLFSSILEMWNDLKPKGGMSSAKNTNSTVASLFLPGMVNIGDAMGISCTRSWVPEIVNLINFFHLVFKLKPT